MSLRTETDVLEFIKPRKYFASTTYADGNMKVYEYDPDVEWVDYKDAEEEFARIMGIHPGACMSNRGNCTICERDSGDPRYARNLVAKISRFTMGKSVRLL